jgi:hypothetical protein
MKTLGRILIILLVAAIVVGGTYALLQTSLAQALAGQPLGSGSENGNSPALSDFANGQGAPTSEMRGGDHEGGSGSWETVGRNLLEIAAIVAAVQVAWSIGRWLKRTAAALTRKDRLNPSRS